MTNDHISWASFPWYCLVLFTRRMHGSTNIITLKLTYLTSTPIPLKWNNFRLSLFHSVLLLSSEWLTNCSVFHLNACHPLDMCQHNLRSHISQSHEDLLMPHAVIPCAAEDTPHTLNHFGWGKRTTLLN